MALSFIVTGTAWKWFLDPGIGIENTMHIWGWESFTFDWIKNRDMAIYTVVIAAVWQTSGFVMAMFLAGLRGIDNEILKAAQMDGASNWNLYRRIILPQLRPAFLSAFVILSHLAIKSYDLVIALTGGGPGNGDRTAGDLHVFLHLHAQPDGDRRGLGGDHADDHRGDHDPLYLCRTEGEEVMAVASLPKRAVRTGQRGAGFVYLCCCSSRCSTCCRFVMVVNSLKPLERSPAAA
jgi:hypothetical protein